MQARSTAEGGGSGARETPGPYLPAMAARDEWAGPLAAALRPDCPPVLEVDGANDPWVEDAVQLRALTLTVAVCPEDLQAAVEWLAAVPMVGVDVKARRRGRGDRVGAGLGGRGRGGIGRGGACIQVPPGCPWWVRVGGGGGRTGSGWSWAAGAGAGLGGAALGGAGRALNCRRVAW